MQALYTFYISALNMILAGFGDEAVTVLVERASLSAKPKAVPFTAILHTSPVLGNITIQHNNIGIIIIRMLDIARRFLILSLSTLAFLYSSHSFISPADIIISHNCNKCLNRS